ncbi:unnamed protein product, partial [Ectocarpus sp. 8 AP-2014]
PVETDQQTIETQAAPREGTGAGQNLAGTLATDQESARAGDVAVRAEETSYGNEQQPVDQEPGSALWNAFSVASSPSRSTSEASPSEEEYYTHQLNVAVTPDGKTITGKCLTYEDGRGGILASNFFEEKLHYSTANPSYRKMKRGRFRLFSGEDCCTVT